MAGPNFPYTVLDANQVLRQCFEETQDRLRVDAIATIESGTMEIVLSNVDDSVAIGTPTALFTATVIGGKTALDVNIANTTAIPVTITGAVVGTSISVYNEITSIAMSSSSNILSYTVPGGKILLLSRVLSSSDSVGLVEIKFNGITNAKERFYYLEFNVEFDYENTQDGYVLPAGTVITIVGTNNSSQGSATFNATLQGILQ